MNKASINVAVLDMNNGTPNQGTQCIVDIILRFKSKVNYKIFDVRQRCELPEIEKYDIYISTGGPGNPLEGDGIWDVQYYDFIDRLIDWNKNKEEKKHVLFICHSFQMACIHFGLAEITRRRDNSFGVMMIHKTKEGQKDQLLDGLDDRYYGVDAREYQVVQPNLKVFTQKGAEILSIEKYREHVKLERAIMAVRFSKYFIGTQFHPEADPISFIKLLRNKEVKEKILKMKGKRKFRDLLENLIDDDKVYKTNETIIPNFLKIAIKDVTQTRSNLVNH